VLLRHVEELQAIGIVEGAIHRLDMREMGVAGWACVRSVGPCPPLEAGPGQLVTGWFHHWRGVVYDLRVESEPEPIRVTALHPFWSVDRQDWVPLSELQRGERLSTWNGSTPMVESLTLREDPEPVYNIEVEGDHCYRVGQQGLLVHNASEPCAKAKITTVGPAGAAFSFQTSFLEWPDGVERNYNVTHQAVALVQLQDDGNDASKAIKDLYKMPVRFIRPRPDGKPVPPPGTRTDWLGRSNGTDTAGHIIPKIAGGRITTDTTENGLPQNASRSSPYGQFTEWLRQKMRGMAQTNEVKAQLAAKGTPAPCRICVQWNFDYEDRNYPFRPSNIIVQVWLDGAFAMKWQDPN
jgi:hypothetical protein